LVRVEGIKEHFREGIPGAGAKVRLSHPKPSIWNPPTFFVF